MLQVRKMYKRAHSSFERTAAAKQLQSQASRGAGDPDVEQLRGYEADPSSHPAASDRSTQLSGLAGPVIAAAAAAAAFLFLR
ncbi:hypothetical protein AK812_SmicGene14945 [Symbiodinium microadriaticum]|uniref:Uncharacterized protein n=1 Tax=Symbiodinium microadriaticum TaxID=2951 RepID=A0A1Q9E482_SYMMI|nr:hypothetical protein AK812_SmicGene14945 [Symbiodinium microadriaticum]